MTLAAFVAVLAVVWVTQVLSRIDFATNSGQSIVAFLKLVVMLTPQLAAIVLPIAVVIGTVQVFSTMNGDSEMAVMSASGMSRGMIARPVLAIAGIASVYLLVSNHFIEPYANRTLRDVLVAARTDLLTTLVREGTFTKLEKDLTIYVDRRLPGNVLAGIMVSDTRDDDVHLIYYAQSGAVGKVDGKEVMAMTNGEIHRRNMGDGTQSIIRFNSYAISLAQFASSNSQTYYAPHERDSADLAYPDPNDRIFQNQPGWVRGELHRRMSDWLYPILFAYIALVVAGQTQSNRQTRFNTYFQGLGGALIYRWGAYAIYSANRNNPELWWLFYALPIGGIAANMTLYYMGVTISVPEPLINAWDNLARRVRQMRVRAARARAA
ncbi:LptF/LptG family permease [Oricola thermophila]|uniref:LptF/LptG family permease n=2 Tax=Oricola thermophila TaxID=2742145 RepID=A0A6N1VCM7_9HYPH|nr:LptF/LptG family permease [Oricola thermophila]